MKIFNNKIFRNVYMTIKICFILMVVLYLSFIMLQRLSGNKSIFGYRLFTVATGSMAGVYDINDVIIVKDCDTKSLKVGDDIAYQGIRGDLQGKLVTHRIIKMEEKSDGKYIYTTKGVASLNHVVKSQVGFFLLIFIPLVLVIVLEVLQTITDIKIEKNEIRRIEKNEEQE